MYRPILGIPMFIGVALFVLVAGAAGPGIAAAQEGEQVEQLRSQIRELSREVEALREDMQRTRVAARTESDSVPPTVAAQFEIRLSQLERALQELTGRVEELQHSIRQTNQNLERLQNDLEFRISQLEGGSAATAGVRTSGEETASADAGASDASERRARESGGTTGGSQGILPEGSASDQYTFAINLLRRQEYAQAQSALAEFIERYPDGPLTANAYYWLGEAYFVQRQFDNAAVQFADGYRNFRDHAYAPRNLLKLGMSLARLEREADACQTLAELNRRFPDAGSHIRQTASDERARLGCR